MGFRQEEKRLTEMSRFTRYPGGQGRRGTSKQEQAAVPDRRAEAVPAEPMTLMSVQGHCFHFTGYKSRKKPSVV